MIETLDWKAAAVELNAREVGKSTALALKLGVAQREELARALASLDPAGEIRVNLPGKWTLYWKLKASGDSRLQVANPAVGEHVATLHLAPAHAAAFVAALKNVGTAVVLSTLGRLAWGSNFELAIEA
jgi:hypothetical protein